MPVVKSMLTTGEIQAFKGTDVYRCSACSTVYRAKKPGCPRNDGRCTRARQIPTARHSG